MRKWSQQAIQVFWETVATVLLWLVLFVAIWLLNGCVTIKGDLVLIKSGQQQDSVSSRRPGVEVKPVTSRPANPISDLLFGGD